MTDKEKILAEIQKRVEFQKTCIKNDYRLNGKAEEEIIFEYQKLINFINTIPNEPVSEKKCMLTKDNYTDDDRKALCESCEEECEFNKKEEPVSEDLEEAALLHLSKHYDTSIIWDEDEKCVVRDFKAGANWKEQQLMAKAIDVEVKVDAGGYPYIQQIELYDYCKDIPLAKEGGKYKVILIKED